MAKRDRRKLESQLLRLIKHIIKWLTQSWKRTKSWYNSIENARKEIRDTLDENPALKNEVGELIEGVFDAAKKEAEEEMDIKTDITELTKKQIFDDPYEWEEK
jgi:regulator of replication initiation timing